MKIALWLMAVLMITVSRPGGSQADETPWEFRFTPYVWTPTLYTDLRIGSEPEVDSDSSVRLLDVLDFAFLANGEARRGEWGVIAEFNYLALSSDATSASGQMADTGVDGVMGGAALAYRIFENEDIKADLLGGFRVWSLEATIDFQTMPSVSRTKTWVDPLFGVRASFDLTRDFFVDGLADVGGFGAGSDLQWEILGRAGYRINDAIAVVVGYRHLAVDFENDGLSLDAAMTGPFVAVDFSW